MSPPSPDDRSPAKSSPTRPHAGALLTAWLAGMLATGARLASRREVPTPTAGRASGSRHAFAPWSAGRPSRRPRRLALLRAPRASLPPDPSSSEVAELARAAADAHPSPCPSSPRSSPVLPPRLSALSPSTPPSTATARARRRARQRHRPRRHPRVRRPAPGFDPSRANAYPAVILVHQFFGLRRREIDLCDALAAEGYVAVAPDTFEGASAGWVPRAISLVAKAGLARGWGAAPLASTIEWTASMNPVDPKRVAIVGFCYGGAAAVRAAAARPDAVRACGVFYGKPPSDERIARWRGSRRRARGVRHRRFAIFRRNHSKFRNVDGGKRRGRRRAEVRRTAARVRHGLERRRAGGAAGDAWNVLLAFLRTHTEE